jgi:hypothetical protein
MIFDEHGLLAIFEVRDLVVEVEFFGLEVDEKVEIEVFGFGSIDLKDFSNDPGMLAETLEEY